jgi:hypothetical protein
MKRPLRIPGALLLLLLLALFGSWVTFPWYAQSMLDRAVSGKGIVLKIRAPARPGLSGIGFGQLLAEISTPPDSCTGISTTWKAKVFNGRISWQLPDRSKPGVTGVTLVADSVEVLMTPAKILFRDNHPVISAHIRLTGSGGSFPEFRADSLSCNISGARIETGNLRLDGVSYRALLTSSSKWVQQPSRFRAETLTSNGVRAPLANFEATFGMAREKPCTLKFTDCSVDLYGMRASTKIIEYNLRKKQTNFVLDIDSLPLDRFTAVAGSRGPTPAVTGNLNASFPLEILDTTLRVSNGTVDATSGSSISFRDASGKPLFSIDAGRGKNDLPLISGLNAEVTIDAKDEHLSGIRIGACSSRVFGGSVTTTPAIWDPKSGSAQCTVSLRELPLLERIRLYGQFRGTMKGTLSGTLPLRMHQGRLEVRNARLFSKGAGNLIQFVPRKAYGDSSSYTGAVTETVWGFSEPALVLDRNGSDGRTRVAFSLKKLTHRSGGGELSLSAPQGTIDLDGDLKKSPTISLSGFSAGLLDGRVSIDHVDYDLRTKHAETVVQVSGIPLQKLLEMQGTTKIIATGRIRGRIPVMLDGETFSIPSGDMSAERDGQIVYSSTPEERAATNAGMRMTYEALGNFLYSSLLSSINMTTDGESRISVQLKGYNPEFQNGRPVNLNLNIEQNLLKLFRSLSIASGIEQSITEKALEKRKKR